ncbi:AAA domain-containing protein [Natrinema thermotolerans]
MKSYLDSLSDAFLEGQMDIKQLSVSPEKIDNQQGWTLQDPVPVDEIINAFRIQETLVQPGGQVLIPLHEEETAEITGEFVFYHFQDDDELLDEESDPHELRFVTDAGTDLRVVSDAKSSYLAYRMRFWHSDYSPPSEPSFLPEQYHDDRPPNPPKELDAVDPLDDAQYEQFVDSIFDALNDQYESETRSAWESSGRPSIRRLMRSEDGDGIGSTIASFTDNNTLRISASTSGVSRTEVESTYGIHQGCIVAVATGDIDNQPIIAGRVTDVGRNDFSVTLDWETANNESEVRSDLDSSDAVSIGILYRNIAFQREFEAFSEMVDTELGKQILAGSDDISFDSPLTVELNTSLELNTYQSQAAINALRANQVYCIHGPPGTGKTRTLTAIIESAVKARQRVLVCAHSNQAVDNIVQGDSTQSDPDSESLHGIIQANGFSLSRVGNSIESQLVSEFYTDTEPREA